MRVLMAPCSWEKENLRGQRKDLISHIMIAVQDLAAGSSVNYSRYRSIFSAYKEFCSDTDILKWIWGAVKGMHVQYIT